MAGEGARRKEQHVDADVLALGRIFVCDRFDRRRHPAQPIFVDRMVEFGGGLAPLDLDEGDDPAAPGHQVYLAARCFHAAREDRPALGLQPERGARFPLAPALFCQLALHSARSSSARA